MSRGPLLDRLDEIEDKFRHRDPSIQEIVQIFKSDGHYLLIVFLVIPFLQPIPLFGLSSPFGCLIGIVAIFAHMNRAPWIPNFWKHKRLPAKTVTQVAEGTEKIFDKISFLFKPRMKFFFRGSFRTLNTFTLVLSSLLLALPLPIPFSNSMPAWAILFQALSNLEEDGGLAVLSYLQLLATLIFFFLISEGISTFVNFVRTNWLT